VAARHGICKSVATERGSQRLDAERAEVVKREGVEGNGTMSRKVAPTFLFLSLCLGGALIVGCRRSETSEPILFPTGRFTSAQQCGTCHRDIYAAWRGSQHARAAENPIFRESYEEAVKIAGDEVARLCFMCHAPTVVLTGDYTLAQGVTREGVTCDFCHSLTGTDLERRDHPFLLDVGATKYGPIRDAASTGHRVAFSEFHLSSLQCAGCHEYRNEHGVLLLSTYSEWERYRQLGGDKECQHCHMPQVLANIVDPKVKRVQGAFVNLHTMPGGHARDQLVRALELRILEAQRTPRGLHVKVRVRNVGAGHAVPTGSPTRKVILRVTVATEGGQRVQQERLYQRVVLDEQGAEIRRDSLLFTRARAIARDTRLAPAEQRVEEFLLPVSTDENLTVTATLIYLYSPHERPQTETRIEFLSEKKELFSRWVR